MVGFNQDSQESSSPARHTWSLQGYINGNPAYMTLLDPEEDCRQSCPFAYLLALIQMARGLGDSSLPQPQLQRQTDLRTDLVHWLEQNATDPALGTLERSRFSPLYIWAAETLKQKWLRPILDFSIPPDRVYDRIAAWQVLEQPLNQPQLAQQVVIITSEGYDEAGVTRPDYFPLPLALQYWRDRPAASTRDSDAPPVFTGAETHAYMIHHLRQQHLVVPIPDIWLVGLAALIGKGLQLKLGPPAATTCRQQRRRWLGLITTTGLYGLGTLQLYITAGVLLPWLLPSTLIWIYVLPAVRRTK